MSLQIVSTHLPLPHADLTYLNNHMTSQLINLHLPILLIQEYPQLIPQRGQIPRDLLHGCQEQIPPPLVISVDWVVSVMRPANVVFGRWEGYGGRHGSL